MVYESCCKLCNPVPSRKEDSSNQSSNSQGKPRDGVYIGETSRSLHERAVEHVRDAESFYPKAHIVKHWMSSHPELDSPPPIGAKRGGTREQCSQKLFGLAEIFRKIIKNCDKL